MARRRKPLARIGAIVLAVGWFFLGGALKIVWWLLVGLGQGLRIGYYEASAKRVLAKWQRKGISLYDTSIWRLLRRIITEPVTDAYGRVECQGCFNLFPFVHCHHIEWISRRPDLAFTPSNLTPLCPECHQLEHPSTPIFRLPNRRSVGRGVRIG